MYDLTKILLFLRTISSSDAFDKRKKSSKTIFSFYFMTAVNSENFHNKSPHNLFVDFQSNCENDRFSKFQ